MKVNLNVNFRTYNGMETGDKIADVVAQALYNYGKDGRLSARINSLPGRCA